MKTMTTLSTAAVLLVLGSAASAADKPEAPRSCAPPIQRVATPVTPATFAPGRHPAMTLRAVELKLGACSALVAANGTVFEAPPLVDGPARIAPAR